MKFKKLNSNVEIDVNISKYSVDWERKVSKPQKAVKDFLFPHWKLDRVLEEFMIPGSRLRIDLMNISQRIAVEISPDSTHKDFNPFMHKNRISGFLGVKKRDMSKYDWITDNGFKYVLITDEELKNLNLNLFNE
jgi:hypothetical protein